MDGFVGYLTTLPVSRLYTVDNRMINEYGAVGGMRIIKGNLSIRVKHTPILIFPQTAHDLIWDRIRAAAVGSLRPTA
jgi:hypothetical protein